MSLILIKAIEAIEAELHEIKSRSGRDLSTIRSLADKKISDDQLGLVRIKTFEHKGQVSESVENAESWLKALKQEIQK